MPSATPASPSLTSTPQPVRWISNTFSTVSYYEWIQNKRMEAWTEAEVNKKLEYAIKRNYRIIRDIARNTPRKTDMHDSRRYCIDRAVEPRAAAMILALRRIEAHYLLEGFSQ